jgi:hypothetical protein
VPFSLDPASGGQYAGPTFGLYTAPLNRTIGFGTARQTQLSVRYVF